MVSFDLLKNSNQQTLGRDFVAALTVSVLLIPQGVAYAVLSGLPPIYGLYSALVPTLLYPFLGSSRCLAVGPVALISIILFAGLSLLADPGSETYIELAIMTAFAAGIIQVIFSLFKLGFLARFISQPVMAGFTAAAAIIIIVSQLSSLLGLQIPRSPTMLSTLKELLYLLNDIDAISLAMGTIGILIILGLKRINRALPGALIAVVLGTITAWLLFRNGRPIAILGELPSGLPSIDLAFIRWSNFVKVLPLALIISLISFIESIAIAKSISPRDRRSVIDPDKELMGLGMSKIIGAFFQAFPTTGSFSRSAIAESSGAQSGWTAIFSGIFVALALLFGTHLLYFLPRPILAAVIISSVVGLIKPTYFKHIYRLDRRDFMVFLTTFALTLLLGIQLGVLAGMILSIFMVLQQTTKPHFAVLGLLPGTSSYRNIKRYPEAGVRDDLLIIRYDADIYFGNAEHFLTTMLERIDEKLTIRTVLLNASSIGHIDSTGIETFEVLLSELKQREIKLILTNIRGPVRDIFNHSGLLDSIGPENNYLNIDDALAGIERENEKGSLSRDYAAQKNRF